MVWQKGESGNPNGRPPKGKSFADVLNKILDEDIKGREGVDRRQALMEKLVKAAYEGEPWAMNAIMDRIDGKPRQSIDQNNKNVHITISQDDADAAL
jgi:hypothetical protein